MARKRLPEQVKDWRLVISWRDDIAGLTETEAKKLFRKLKETISEVSRGHQYPTIELREGHILRDFFDVKPK